MGLSMFLFIAIKYGLAATKWEKEKEMEKAKYFCISCSCPSQIFGIRNKL
jgi:hypothetical protein